ncbi:MAG: hypothetical protein HYT36_03135 [Candidatus Staskawiczbacteria bacterium]|nr:hypothetical protein [Candidatus Staskawiczbacteria bacterium]
MKEVRRIKKLSEKGKKKILDNPSYKKILGTGEKVIAPSEKEIYPGDKRSVFAIENIKKGERLNKKNIAVLRAERYLKPGIHPRFFELVLGKKSARPVKKYAGLQWEHLLNN